MSRDVDTHLATEICERVADAGLALAPVLPEPAGAIVAGASLALRPLCEALEAALDDRDARRRNQSDHPSAAPSGSED